MDNFPIAPILHDCQSIIGSYVNPVAPLPKEELTSSVDVIRRATELRFNVETINKFPKCDYVFEPADITSISLIDTKRVDEAYEIGYRTAIEHMDQIKQSLEVAEKKTIQDLVGNLVVVFFMLVALFVILHILNLSDAVTALLGTAGVAGLAVGLALQGGLRPPLLLPSLPF